MRLVKEEKKALVKDEAISKANDKLVKLLVPSMKKASQGNNPLENLFGGAIQTSDKIMKKRKNHLLKRLKLNVLKLKAIR